MTQTSLLTVDEIPSMRAELADILGMRPVKCGAARVLGSSEAEGIRVESLCLNEDIRAVFTRPCSGDACGAVVYCHANGKQTIGKLELIRGREELCDTPYSEDFASIGLASIAIDNRGYGERDSRSLESLFKESIWKGENLWARMVEDNLVALDYLLQRPDIDCRRVSALGFSMGGTMAWWLAALDERVRRCVDICSLTDFHEVDENKRYDCRSLYFFVFGLLNRFQTVQINALIAPRPHLCIIGNEDPRTVPSGLDRLEGFTASIYEALDRASNWRLLRFPVGHEETKEMRLAVLEFLREWAEDQ